VFFNTPRGGLDCADIYHGSKKKDYHFLDLRKFSNLVFLGNVVFVLNNDFMKPRVVTELLSLILNSIPEGVGLLFGILFYCCLV
jgi:hypothetical protein